MAEQDKSKKHADFQDSYHRSSNFNNPIKKENFEIKKNGKLKLDQDKDLDESEKKRIEDAMDSFEERTEITPGGEQSDDSDEK